MSIGKGLFELLQFIMQFVTFEVCASLIFPAASAPPAGTTMQVVSNTHIDARSATMHSLRRYDSNKP